MFEVILIIGFKIIFLSFSNLCFIIILLKSTSYVVFAVPGQGLKWKEGKTNRDETGNMRGLQSERSKGQLKIFLLDSEFNMLC